MPRKGQFKTHCLRGHPRDPNAKRKGCLLCRPALEKKYWAKNKEKLNAKRKKFRAENPDYDREYQRRVRTEGLSHYGGKCACCGENNYEFLAFDHIHGGGTKHRREMNISGGKFAFWLRRQGYPEGYRVLCHNCNVALGMYGYCPHTKKDSENGNS